MKFIDICDHKIFEEHTSMTYERLAYLSKLIWT